VNPTVARVAFRALLFACTFATLAFLVLPLVAVFAHVPPGTLIGELSNPVVSDALRLTVETNVVSLCLLLAVGTPCAYQIAGRRRFRGRSVVLTLIELPLVLPPAVAGIGLLAAYSSIGLLHRPLAALGIDVVFTTPAVVLAVLFVSSPFYIRQAIAAFEAVDPDVTDASRTLGAGPAKTFARVALPLAAGGLGAGAVLAFARGVGEFGATIMFAGNLRGVSQTLPLAIYQEFEVDFDAALAIGALLIVFSATILLCAKLVVTWTRYASTSRSDSAASTFAPISR
jgi:molybdate transport system permease protein